MSANVELVRSIFERWEEGDFSSAEWADPEIQFAWADGPSPARWSGLVGMAEGMRELLSAWEGYRVRADAYEELDGERVLVIVQARGRGKTSGIELGDATGQVRGANVFALRDGLVTSIACYFGLDRAYADLGIEAHDEG